MHRKRRSAVGVLGSQSEQEATNHKARPRLTFDEIFEQYCIDDVGDIQQAIREAEAEEAERRVSMFRERRQTSGESIDDLTHTVGRHGMKTHSITRVQQRGQITLPKEMRERTHIAPGDLVKLSVTDAETIQVEPVRVKPIQYFWEKFTVDGPFDHEAIRQEAEDIAAREAMGE
jgi:AbrB family looped-hinge helix DNA binding protein